MITKKEGVDFHNTNSALTLEALEVSDRDPEGGIHSRTHYSGWTITGEVIEDYYTWVNKFKAEHPTFGVVEGDFEDEVIATSEAAFKHFYANHSPHQWDYDDI